MENTVYHNGYEEFNIEYYVVHSAYTHSYDFEINSITNLKGVDYTYEMEDECQEFLQENRDEFLELSDLNHYDNIEE